jgi:2-polyprenyl-3-methyl-5-hydroxy-6-metoxy-1,4-benzoquinol methylase
MADATRQYAPELSGIREDHRLRYEFAPVSGRVLDAACGCGYGSKIMQSRGCLVFGIDIEPAAIQWAAQYFPGPQYAAADITLPLPLKFDAVVSFETLEHLDEPHKALRNFREMAPLLVASVPNEEKTPFVAKQYEEDAYPHRRHYRPVEFEQLLNGAGWEVTERHTQTDIRGPLSVVRPGTDGRFLVYTCTRS